MFRPDAPAFVGPALYTGPPIVTQASATAPTKDADNGTLQVGQVWMHADTGSRFYWTGTAWAAVTVAQAECLNMSLLFEIRDLLQAQVSDDE